SKKMGADLQREQVLGDKKIGQAKGEEGRGMGVACEEEMKGGVEEMRGKVVEGESEVGLGMGEGLR
ncbi:flotillin-like FloA family protein, partial [Staphylococcus epidermidis]|uniref:flotillin-like FloA family protein n=1 Tax=Staphylococcus epidermidis TaxID=1282 RepID=UPI001642CF4B